VTDSKDGILMIEVTIEADLPEGGTGTATAYLGKDPVRRRNLTSLTPLYFAGDLPGALRYGLDRDTELGGDSWGARSANALIAQLPALVIFNDLSLEHGGPWGSDHRSHKVGTSIDALYPGGGGGGNTLNFNITDRENLWSDARGGNLAARRTMVEWIRTVHANMDTIFDAGTPPSFIYVGRLAWNWVPIVSGTYGDGTTILDPDSGTAIGAWQSHGDVRQADKHENHIHIEMRPSMFGNPR